MVICVLGAGTMGSGIAQVAAQSGFDTILFDVQQEALGRAEQQIGKNLQQLVDKQKIDAATRAAITNRIRYTRDIQQCMADVVIEAIAENMEAKTSLFSQLAIHNSESTIFATNTSSLSVSELQKRILHPERVVGMHFFNPAPLMRLVEVVQGEQTSTATTTAIVDLVRKMGKTPVLCKDAPGFIVNRVARPYYLEAMRLAERNAASPKELDAIMQATGFKMGPFSLMDLIGLDINYAVSCSVYEQMGKPARLQPSALQQQHVAAGRLGRKTGEGFYTY